LYFVSVDLTLSSPPLLEKERGKDFREVKSPYLRYVPWLGEGVRRREGMFRGEKPPLGYIPG